MPLPGLERAPAKETLAVDWSTQRLARSAESSHGDCHVPEECLMFIPESFLIENGSSKICSDDE